MITAITPTGDREASLNLLCRWVSRQEVKPDQWIVIDDGKKKYKPNCEEDYFQYIRRVPKKGELKHTLKINIALALSKAKGDKIIILEDDEYYAPKYIKTMSDLLEENELAGISHSRYYHIGTRGYDLRPNTKHASLAQTVFRSSLKDFVLGICGENKTLDLVIWKRYSGKSKKIIEDKTNPLTVGFKGMPGREGIGIGHKVTTYNKFDEDLSMLESWIRNYDDFLLYKRLMEL